MAGVSNQVHDKTLTNTSLDNAQEHTSGCEDTDHVLGFDDLFNF